MIWALLVFHLLRWFVICQSGSLEPTDGALDLSDIKWREPGFWSHPHTILWVKGRHHGCDDVWDSDGRKVFGTR